MNRALGLAVLAGVIGGNAAYAESLLGQSGHYGLQQINETFLLQSGSLVMETGSAVAMQKGERRWTASHSISNSFGKSKEVESALKKRGAANNDSSLTKADLQAIAPGKDIYFADGQLSVTRFYFTEQFSDKLQFGVEIPLVQIHGGYTDELIEDFHDGAGFGDHGRDGTARDDVGVYIRNGSFEYFDEGIDGIKIGDPILSAKYSFMKPSELGLQMAVKSSLKLSVRDAAFYSSGSSDLGVQFITEYHFSRATLHADVAATYLGDYDALGIDSQVRWGGNIGVELGMTKNSSFLMQISAHEPLFFDEHINELSEMVYEVSLGVNWAISDKTLVKIALVENAWHLENSSDVGLHFAVGRNL